MRPLFAIVAGVITTACAGCGQRAVDDTAATTSSYVTDAGRTIKALSGCREDGLLDDGQIRFAKDHAKQ